MRILIQKSDEYLGWSLANYLGARGLLQHRQRNETKEEVPTPDVRWTGRRTAKDKNRPRKRNLVAI